MRTSVLSALIGAGCLLMANADPAAAQATRTWVSGVGDDANPCSRTAPCKTFAGAISKTAASGEINCIDPGGFGAVTITKSITIDCDGTFGLDPRRRHQRDQRQRARIHVHLRNISINGALTGLIGINFTTASSLPHNVNIFGFNTGTAAGIKFAPSSGQCVPACEQQLHREQWARPRDRRWNSRATGRRRHAWCHRQHQD